MIAGRRGRYLTAMRTSRLSSLAPWRAALRSALVAVVVVTALVVLPLRGDRWWWGIAAGVVLLAVLVVWLVDRVRRVARSERPVVEAAAALVQVLFVLVAGFAATYYALNHDGTQVAGLETRIDALYFTVTTLSTVGFGDVVAVGQEARIVVIIQILFNLVFLGTAVRVLSAAANRRWSESTAAQEPTAPPE